MKTFKSFILLGLTAFVIVSCASSKDTAKSNRGMSNTQVLEKTPSEGQISARNKPTMEMKSSVTPMDLKGDDYAFAKIQPMYAEVDMDDEQISRFENAWKKSVDSWRKNNPNQKMNTYERVETQDRILMDILDDSQFDVYQQWAIANANAE